MDKCDLVALEKSIGRRLAAAGNDALPLVHQNIQLNSFAARAYPTKWVSCQGGVPACVGKLSRQMCYINPALPTWCPLLSFYIRDISTTQRTQTSKYFQPQDAWYSQAGKCCWVLGPSHRHWYIRCLWWYPLRVCTSCAEMIIDHQLTDRW